MSSSIQILQNPNITCKKSFLPLGEVFPPMKDMFCTDIMWEGLQLRGVGVANIVWEFY
jgi:hypothetical protein